MATTQIEGFMCGDHNTKVGAMKKTVIDTAENREINISKVSFGRESPKEKLGLAFIAETTGGVLEWVLGVF
jgi:hypothetical protein